MSLFYLSLLFFLPLFSVGLSLTSYRTFFMCARSAQEMEDWIITMELVLKCEGVCVGGGW